MPRGLGWTLAGCFAGLGALFFTVWSGSADAASMAAVMFAVASIMIVSTEVRPGGRDKGSDKTGDQASTD